MRKKMQQLRKYLAFVALLIGVGSVVYASDLIRFTGQYESDNKLVEDEISVRFRGPTISGIVSVIADTNGDGVKDESVPVAGIVVVARNENETPVNYVISGIGGQYKLEVPPNFTGTVAPLGDFVTTSSDFSFPIVSTNTFHRGCLVQDMDPEGDVTDVMDFTAMRLELVDGSFFGYVVTDSGGVYEFDTPSGFDGVAHVLGKVVLVP